jgi:hypothetical protein
MSLAGLHHCMDRMAFRESVGFSAGQSYERRRISDILRQRINDLRTLGAEGLPARTVKSLTAEVELLIQIIEKEAA